MLIQYCIVSGHLYCQGFLNILDAIITVLLCYSNTICMYVCMIEIIEIRHRYQSSIKFICHEHMIYMKELFDFGYVQKSICIKLNNIFF